MAGRNRTAFKFREVPISRAQLPSPPRRTLLIDDPRLLHRLPRPSAADRPLPTVALEDLIVAQRREIQSLLVDNQRLASTHMALKQEVSLAQLDLRRLTEVAAGVKAETEAQVREAYETWLNIEAEVRAVDLMTTELAQVRGDVQKLIAAREELTAQLQAIEDDIARRRPDSQELMGIEAEIKSERQEIQRGRAAIEYEKKTYSYNLEQSQAMEKGMMAMAREVEKLQAELADADKRARATAAAATVENPSPGYGASYCNPDMDSGGSIYAYPYAINQVQGAVDAGFEFVSGATHVQGPYVAQQNHNHR